jgi:hypothetical protein
VVARVVFQPRGRCPDLRAAVRGLRAVLTPRPPPGEEESRRIA